MRVSIITALVLYGDVPLEVLMQVVGHAQIIMTLHYTKVAHADIVREMSAGEKKALAHSQDRMNALIIEDKIHEHKGGMVIPTNSPLHDPDWPTASILFLDYGLCPYGGTLCHKGSKEEKDAPVPAGFLGCQNCLQCRHFVTGIAFHAALMAKANEIAEAKQYTSIKTHDLATQIDQLDEEIYDFEKSKKEVPLELKVKRKRLSNLLEQEESRHNMLACDFLSAWKLLHSITELYNKSCSEGGKMPMVMNCNSLSISVDEVSQHQALAEVCENAEIFLSANADLALPRRTIGLDRMLEMNGLPPPTIQAV